MAPSAQESASRPWAESWSPHILTSPHISSAASEGKAETRKRGDGSPALCALRLDRHQHHQYNQYQYHHHHQQHPPSPQLLVLSATSARCSPQYNILTHEPIGPLHLSTPTSNTTTSTSTSTT
ncbi:unnamed protein product [Merluccius merluccius]